MVYSICRLPDIAAPFLSEFVPSHLTLPVVFLPNVVTCASILSPAHSGDLWWSLASVLHRICARHLRPMHQYREFTDWSLVPL